MVTLLDVHRGAFRDDRTDVVGDDREALLEFVGERAHEALDASTDARDRGFRDRALVTMLALTGARGAELFADPRDEHRNGLRWEDVDIDRGIAIVFGKTRESQSIPLTNHAVESLERYRKVLNPATEDWLVFPTRHHGSLATAAGNGLEARGWDAEEIETTHESYREQNVIERRERLERALDE